MNSQVVDTLDQTFLTLQIDSMVMEYKQAHELFNLTDEQAAECLCQIARIVVDEAKPQKIPPEKAIEMVSEDCKLYAAYMLGLYIGLHTQLADYNAFDYIYSMMEDLREGRTELALAWIRKNEMDKKFDLSEEEMLYILTILSDPERTRFPLETAQSVEEKYRVPICFIIGYLDGIAAQASDFDRVRREVKFLAEVYVLCSQGRKEDVAVKIRRIKSEFYESQLRDII